MNAAPTDAAPPALLSSERAWTLAAAALVCAAFVARVHNAFAYPPLLDFDAAPHALNVFAFYEGRLPDPKSWAGFHPPLYFAFGALLWRILPDAIPVHVALRLLSAAAGFTALAIAWRALRRFVSPADAAVTAALVAGAPVFAIATSMLGNETTCALFATAALARLCAIPGNRALALSHAWPTALLAALAALSKSTGLAVVPVVALAYFGALRNDRRMATRAGLLCLGLPVLLVAPHYGRLVVASGSLRALISGGAPSDAAGSEMAAQPPGERQLSDYLLVPSATFFAPFVEAPEMVRSVPGLLYATTWADGHGQFLPATSRGVVTAAALCSLFGLVPTALMVAGAIRIARKRRAYAAAFGPNLFAVLLVAAFLVQTWVVPRYSAVKASYLLPALLPFALALAVGVSSTRGVARGFVRAFLLLFSAFATGVTWYGWWT
jgi:hypothetical protein